MADVQAHTGRAITLVVGNTATEIVAAVEIHQIAVVAGLGSRGNPIAANRVAGAGLAAAGESGFDHAQIVATVCRRGVSVVADLQPRDDAVPAGGGAGARLVAA